MFIEIQPIGGKFHVVMNGATLHKAGNQTAAQHTVDKQLKVNPSLVQVGLGAIGGDHVGDGSEGPVEEFDVNERFEFLEALVTMVADGSCNSAIVVGQGGLGKTKTVIKALTAAGLQDRDEMVAHSEIGAAIPNEGTYTFIKGSCTARMLYELLYNRNGQTLVFDDCDSIQKDLNALNVLKAALDSYDKRIISWHAKGIEDEGLPASFEFTGRIIFISNKAMSTWDSAVKSRCLTVDVHMTRAQIIERMRHIAESEEFMPDFPAETKMAALEIIDRHKDRVKDLNFRTLIKATQAYANAKPEKAEALVTYLITN